MTGGGESLRRVVIDLATGLRERVLPELGSPAGRAHRSAGEGGDVTFAIDEEAEQYLETFIAERAPQLAFYSEDRGLVAPGGRPEHVLVVDPIDGTRPAMAGFEAACVSVALAPMSGGGGPGRRAGPLMRDVSLGVIVEIKSGHRFVAERGRGLEASVPIALSPTSSLDRLFWVYGLRGRPARPMMEVLGDIVDASSVGGASFELGSATYDMTRIVTGQLDAYVEPGPRLVAEVPGMRAAFERVGGGALLNNSPYDLAAAVLCCTEAGAIVTDGHGRPLDDRPLLGSGGDFQMSVIAASNARLHARLVDEVDRGIGRLQGAGA